MVKFPEPLDGPVETGARYAIYFAPGHDAPLHALGSRWLGRDSIKGNMIEQPVVPGMTTSRLSAVTAAPRGYGFHATLKPPFHLKPGQVPKALLEASQALAQKHEPYEVNFVLRQFSDFFALMQGQSKVATQALAAAAVSELDGFRALPGERELDRHRQAGLSGAQESLLQRWGYPFVMNEFRFHMTLSQRITNDAEADVMRTTLQLHFQKILECPQWIDAITVFRQDQCGAPFVQVERFPLGRTA
jgi:hypothetical protein